MRRMLASAAVLHAVALWSLALHVLAASPAHAGTAGPGPGVTANDTGGIIQSTPETSRTYKEIAAGHGARFGRFAGISSVRRSYGEYIAFQCVYDRRFDPRKMGLPPTY